MRYLPNGLQEKLDSGATTLCRCWRLTRNDGIVMGFTDHDQPLSFDSMTFQADSGFGASQLEASLGLRVDTVELVGALSSARITEADIIKGLYDEASMTIWLVDWQDVSLRVVQFKGTIGKVSRGVQTQEFTAELMGVSSKLNETTGRAFMKTCDAELGDARCGFSLTPVMGSVTSVETASRIGSDVSGDFTRGILTWVTGANAGAKVRVREHKDGVLTLWQDAPLAVAVGDTFSVTQGCDKQFATCRDRFGNHLNFQGFPYMVGDDWIVSYPNSGEGHTGGSRYK